MNVLIIEDEKLIAAQLEAMLMNYNADISVKAILPSVTKAVSWLREYNGVDLIFMDIHLEDNLAFEIFDHVEINTPVIFTTAYDEYVLQAFKTNGIDYLLKPVQPRDLEKALAKYQSLDHHFLNTKQPAWIEALRNFTNKNYKQRFMVSIGNRIHSIDISEIAYFFLDNKITYMVTFEGKRLPVSQSLDSLVQSTDPSEFFRINRQYLIAHKSIKSMQIQGTGKLVLELNPSAAHEVSVSGDRLTLFKEWLGK